MLVEDSSSLSANPLPLQGFMVISQIMQAYSGVIEITPGEGPAFFLRTSYLNRLKEEDLFSGAEISDEDSADLLEAALVYGVEKAAMSYLARAEHSRFTLSQKLIKKGMDKSVINRTLDYLESVNYLNDERFAGAWLRSRSIDHAEGRIRLAAELSARGVDKTSAKKALDEFFGDHDELEICRKAFRKAQISRKTEEKIRMTLAQKGFSLKFIDIVVKENI